MKERLAAFMKSHGILVGAVAAFVVGAAGLYEGIAIVSPLPTWSRMFQGLRDSSTIGAGVVGFVAVALGAVATLFGGWVVHHLKSDKRSSL
jgi:hypothetical protein